MTGALLAVSPLVRRSLRRKGGTDSAPVRRRRLRAFTAADAVQKIRNAPGACCRAPEAIFRGRNAPSSPSSPECRVTMRRRCRRRSSCPPEEQGVTCACPLLHVLSPVRTALFSSCTSVALLTTQAESLRLPFWSSLFLSPQIVENKQGSQTSGLYELP